MTVKDLSGKDRREAAKPLLANIAARLRDKADSYENHHKTEFGQGIAAGLREAARDVEIEKEDN